MLFRPNRAVGMHGILLDLTPLVTPSTLRGIGRYARGLVQGLSELPAPTDFEIAGITADQKVRKLAVVSDLLGYVTKPVALPVRQSLERRNRLVTFSAPRVARRAHSLLHLTDPDGFPLSKPEGHCMTCHDLIPLILHREYLWRAPWARPYRAFIEKLRYQRARRVLAVSHATKRDLCEQLELPDDRVDVVWHGVDHHIFHPRKADGETDAVQRWLGSTRPYVLYVGAGDPRKDLDTLITAFARSRLAHDALLVIVGQLRAPRIKALKALARRAGVSEQVKLTGYAEEAIIPALYRGASVHVFASRYEGFGFPVVEALACGAPTITSPNSSLDEVAGDAALIVPCGEPDALAPALEHLFFDTAYAAELWQRGLTRAAGFTWRACAEQTLAFWRRALAT
jgi:glycosyltransferase involved in cell wall biosynthesis